MSASAGASRRIGEVAVTRIEESCEPLFDPSIFFPDWDAAAVVEHRGWLEPRHIDPRSGKIILSIHSWLLRTPHHTILIDACGGNDKGRPGSSHFHMQKRPYLERLAAAGVSPAEIDYVLCTHLHVDHVGWNTRLVDGRWVPTFPRAKYLFSRIEAEYWAGPGKPAAGLQNEARHRAAFEDSVRPVIASGQALLVEGEHRLGDELLIEPAPGHSPGHFVVKLSSGGQEGIFIGDALHHPIQVHFPEWNSRVCLQPEQAVRTRRRLLEECAAEDSLMLPAHFAAPHAARIRRRGERFSFLFE